MTMSWPKRKCNAERLNRSDAARLAVTKRPSKASLVGPLTDGHVTRCVVADLEPGLRNSYTLDEAEAFG